MDRLVTWDLREGFHKLRWSDRLETARALYPDAGHRKARRGVDPETGKPIVITAGLTIDDQDFFPVPRTGLTLRGSVGFDEMGVTDLSIDCFGSAEDPEADPEDLQGSKLRWLEASGHKLGFGPLRNVVAQSWNLLSVTVDLSLKHDGFNLDFTPRRDAGRTSRSNP